MLNSGSYAALKVFGSRVKFKKVQEYDTYVRIAVKIQGDHLVALFGIFGRSKFQFD